MAFSIYHLLLGSEKKANLKKERDKVVLLVVGMIRDQVRLCTVKSGEKRQEGISMVGKGRM